MPKFDFQCGSCDDVFEERRSFGEPTDSAQCPACGGASVRVYLSAPMTLVEPRGGGNPAPMLGGGPGGDHGHGHGHGHSHGHGHGHSHGPGSHTH